MYYCKKCKLLNKETTCKKCGKFPLPQAQSDDVCFFVKLYYMHATMLEEALKTRSIPVFSVPCGFSLRLRSSDDRNVYVPYEFFNEANEVYKAIFFRTTESDGEEKSANTKEPDESQEFENTEESEPTDNAKDDNDEN